MKRQIIALGGGGFSMDPRNRRLDSYILSQASSPIPKVCFIPTASGDSRNYLQRFHHSFSKYNCITNDLELFKPKYADFESFLLEQDIIYVGGGNTPNFINSGLRGRFFEVTPTGEIVWEYWNPYVDNYRLPDGTSPTPLGPFLYMQYRIEYLPIGHPAFVGRSLVGLAVQPEVYGE